MGIKLKDGEIVRFDNALQRRPELAQLIGLIVSECALSEMVMAIFFAHMLRLDIPTGTAILDAVAGKHQKRNQLVAVAKAKIKDADLRDRIITAVDKLSDAITKRDVIAHGKWATCESPRFAGRLLWQKTTWGGADGFEQYDVKRLGDIVNEIISRKDALQMLVREIPTNV